MKQNILSIFLAFSLFFGIANAIAIIPPVVYFVTVSISTFIANSIVALLIFGVLKGISMRRFFGKGMYEIMAQGLGAISNGILAIICMLISIWLFSPIDFESILVCALFASLLFLFFKSLLSIKQLSIADLNLKKRIIFSWIVLALFIGLATWASATFSMNTHAIPINDSYNLENSISESKSMVQNVEDSINGAANLPSMSKTASQNAPASEAKTTPFPTPLQSEASNSIDSKETQLWFFPITSDRCTILADSFSQSFQPAFNCYYAGPNGGRIRIFCPVSISHSSVQMRGQVQFIATGGCSGNIRAIITNSGFENIQRDA